MPDYTSILRRSISALPDSSSEMREAVYQRARAALARQLTAVDPPLSTREIERQHQELEDAAARLEAEFAPDPAAEPEADEPTFQEDYFAPEMPVAAVLRSDPVDRSVAGPAESLQDRDYDGDDEEDEEGYDEDERSSRTPLLVGLLMLVLVIGGISAYGFAQREALLSFLGMSDTGEVETAAAPLSPVVTPDPPPAEPVDLAGIDAADKLPDRLTNGSEAPPSPEPSPPPVLAEPEPPPSLPAEEALPVEPLPPDGAPGPQEEQTAALDPPEQGTGGSIVAQRAIYYFQGQEGSPGRAVEGTVAWAEITRDSAPAVQATLRMPDQNVTTTVTIYKNSDSTLPASHLVEVQFSGEVGASPIQRVPALVVKQTEQARGQPLTGAAVPVTDELFWIALSDDDEQIARNLQLLREGSWFDIPILFNDGTRALLTFEKGIPGDRVFETVMSAWTPA